MTNPMPFDTAMALLHDAAAGLAVVKGGDPADHFRTLLDAANVCTAQMLDDIVAQRCPMTLEDAQDTLATVAATSVVYDDRDTGVMWLATAALVSTADLLRRSTAAD